MKTIKIKRVKKFACSLLPFWVISKMSKSRFLESSRLQESASGEICTAFPDSVLEAIDTAVFNDPIRNGKQITISADDSCRSLFVITSTGMVSNEVFFETDIGYYEIELTIKSGWKTPACPVLRIL